MTTSNRITGLRIKTGSNWEIFRRFQAILRPSFILVMFLGQRSLQHRKKTEFDLKPEFLFSNRYYHNQKVFNLPVKWFILHSVVLSGTNILFQWNGWDKYEVTKKNHRNLEWRAWILIFDRLGYEFTSNHQPWEMFTHACLKVLTTLAREDRTRTKYSSNIF